MNLDVRAIQAHLEGFEQDRQTHALNAARCEGAIEYGKILLKLLLQPEGGPEEPLEVSTEV